MLRDQCPICAGIALDDILKREAAPVVQNVVFASKAAAKAVARADIDLVFCPLCDFLFNRAYDPALSVFDDTYENTVRESAAFTSHVEDRIRHLVVNRNLRAANVLEVGCGKGDFLRLLADYGGANNVCLGYDTSYVGPLSDLGGRLTVVRRYLDASDRIAVDAVVLRHVLYEVADPRSLLRTIADAVSGAGTRIYVESPRLEWILEHGVFWDIFYEYCSYLGTRALQRALEFSGFRPDFFESVFGDQYVWIEASSASEQSPDATVGNLADAARAFGTRDSAYRAGWIEQLRRDGRDGNVALWGAGAKGTSLANAIDPGTSLLRCLIDVNPRKHGHFIAGTAHPIVGPEAVDGFGITKVYVMNPNYVDEVRELLRMMGSAVAVCTATADPQESARTMRY